MILSSIISLFLVVLLIRGTCNLASTLTPHLRLLSGIVMIPYQNSTAFVNGRTALSNLVKAVELGRRAWYPRPTHLRALSLLLTVLPETAENPSGKGFIILLVATAAGVSSFITYLVLKDKYRPTSVTELPKITQSDLMDQPGPDIRFAIEQQTTAERQFFHEANQRRVRNLELIERGIQLVAQRRKQFAVLFRVTQMINSKGYAIVCCFRARLSLLTCTWCHPDRERPSPAA